MKKTQLVKLAIKHGINYYLQKISFYTNLNLCKPSQVFVFITLSCNLKCKQCDSWKCKNIKELSTEEWKKIIEDLKKWLGYFHLVFTGGEPLLRRDIVELIKFASKLGITTSVNTNGIPISKEMADRLIRSGLDRLNISLDGINAKTHDSLRGKGVFKKVISNIEHLSKKRKHLKICIDTILMGKNLDEIIRLVKWEKSKGLYGAFQALTPNSFSLELKKYRGGYRRGWYKKNKFWPKDTNKVRRVIDDIILMKKKGYNILNSIKQLELMKEYFKYPNRPLQNLSCITGVDKYYIFPEGSVLLCFFRRPIGNLAKQSAKDIWLSKKATSLRRQIKKCKKQCILMNCNFDEGLKSKVYKFRGYVQTQEGVA